MIRTPLVLFPSLFACFALSGCFAKETSVEDPPIAHSANADEPVPESSEPETASAGEGHLVVREEELLTRPPSGIVDGLGGSAHALDFEALTTADGNGGLVGAKGPQIGLGGLGGHGAAIGRAGAKATHRAPVRGAMRRTAPPFVRPHVSSEEYTDHGVNPFTAVADDAKSTFSIDVDTASYTLARRKLQGGVLPAWEGIRAEEFVNFFDYDYADPRKGPFSVDMEAMPDPFRSGHHILRVGVQAKRYSPAERPPLHLTFLVDVSGSMSSRDKLGLAKASMHTLVDNLNEGDTVAMATYAGRTARILGPTDAADRRRIHAAIDSLHSGGSTAMASGIDMAYEMADEAFERGAENRVIVLSDGDANVGATSWEDMLRRIKGYADQGITLSTIGFGQGNYRDTLMEQLANNGDGNNFYVDSRAESDRIFGEKIGGTMITVARDTKIQVEFNPDAVKSYRLIGYENRDIADKDFRNDRVDAGEVGSGHSVTALYEVALAEDPADQLATVRIRWEHPGADKRGLEAEFSFASDDMVEDSHHASSDTIVAYSAASFAEVLRQSPHAKKVDLMALKTMVSAVDADRDVRELARLIGDAARLIDFEDRAQGG